MSDPTTQKMMMGAAGDSPQILLYGDVYRMTPSGAISVGTGMTAAATSKDGLYGIDYINSSVYLKKFSGFSETIEFANTLPGLVNDVTVSADGVYFAVAHRVSPFLTIYKRTGSSYAKLTNPSTLPTNEGVGVSFSADSTYLAVAHANSPFVSIYKRSGDTFTKLSNPATLPTTTGMAVAFSPNMNHLAVQTTTTTLVYSRSGDTFTLLSSPFGSVNPVNYLRTDSGSRIAYSADNSYVIMTFQYLFNSITYIGMSFFDISGNSYTLRRDETFTTRQSNSNGRIGLAAISRDGIYIMVSFWSFTQWLPRLCYNPKGTGNPFFQITGIPNSDRRNLAFNPTAAYGP